MPPRLQQTASQQHLRRPQTITPGGELYLGALASGTTTAKHIVDGVDAGARSVKGKFIAVPRERIFSNRALKIQEKA
ncbi:nuclear pore complex protein [Salix suchowensis]|nr:nuclear pore complex protein [Salix suchowensis]